MLRFVGTVHRNTNIFSLLLSQPGQFDSDLFQVQPGDFLIQFFR